MSAGRNAGLGVEMSRTQFRKFGNLSRALCLAAALGAMSSVAVAEGISVGSASSLSLGSGTLGLGCGDLEVAGTFNADSGTVNEVRDLTIAGGGTLNGGSGVLNVTQNWSNSGTFAAGTSTVNLVDGCATSHASISGSSTFATLSVATASGKRLQLEAGSTQTVNTGLSLTGGAGNHLAIRSSSPGSEATLDVLGTASADFVDVEDIHLTTTPIEVDGTSILGSNTTGWSFLGLAVPSLSLLAAAFLALSLIWTAKTRLVSQP